MKTIKDLTIKVTYTVGLCDIEVPDSIYDALAQCYDEGGEVPMPDECSITGRKELERVAEWLSDNINETDAMDWEYEIETFEE